MPDAIARRVRRASRALRWRLAGALAPRRTARARGIRFTLGCDNWITQFRVDTLDTKEPETLDWIDTRVGADDVFFDVGGNVGLFALYAALRHPRVSVVVFEPEYANLHLLRDNVAANRLGDRIQIYPFALSDTTGVSRLHVQDLTPGAALHSESAAPRATTDAGERVLLSEGTWAMTLDDFCAQAGVWPNAIKIDVDGGESRVLAGARQVLSRPGLQSVIVEAGAAGLRPETCDLLRTRGLHRIDIGPSAAGNEVWVR